MLNSLRFEVEFPTGLTIKRDITFDQGSTAISGKNGTGKSLILEMICFALFGQEATRGSADDYKKVVVELELTIKGFPYRITRTGKDAQLKVWTEDGVDYYSICTGTRPVNQKIVEILGYGYNVFQVSNLIGQGQIEALTAMKPADRKKLVDTTIGLDAVDTVIAWTSNEAALSRKEAETLASVLVEPTEPVKPDGYIPWELLKPQVEQAAADKEELDKLKGWLTAMRPEPKPPECPTETPSEILRASADAYVQAVSDLEAKRRVLATIPEAKHTAAELTEMTDQLARHAAWAAYDTTLAALPPRSLLTEEKVHALLEQWAHYDAYTAAEGTECPKCGHTFTPGVQEVEQPALTRQELLTQLKSIQMWQNAPQEPQEPRPTMEVTWTTADLNTWLIAVQRADDRVRLISEIESTVIPTDTREEFTARMKYEGALVDYNTSKAQWEAWKAERDLKLIRQGELGDADARLQEMNAAKQATLFYERLLLGHETALAAYVEAKARMEAVAQRGDEMKKSTAALKDLKAKVKTFLVPSLNRVASHLIQQMTDGQHQQLSKVEVTEELEISVDGQPLETLNGSGKTVANLAVRIGLGQILTNKVFSVLMADEVDAACDDERADAIAACLKGLTSNIKQVVSVSHKGIQADHYVVL